MPPDLLADVQHRRLVALALADDDRPREVRLVHRAAHRLGRGLVGLVALALAHEPRGRDRRGLGDPDHLEREQLLQTSDGWLTSRLRRKWRKWRAREHHRQVVAVRDLDRHLVADRAARLDDRRDAGVGRDLDAVGEREVGVRRHDRELGPVAGPPERDVDRDVAGCLRRADPDRRPVAREHDRVRPHVPDGAPGEQQVGELAQGRVAPGHDLELAAVEVDGVERLHQQPAADPLEVEVRDPVVAHALGREAGTASSSRPGLRRRIASAASLKPGAITAS